MNNIKIFYSNLNKNQRVLLWVIIQFIVFITLFFTIKSIFKEKTYIELPNNSVFSQLPEDTKNNFHKTLWQLITDNDQNLNQNSIKDINIREDTYQESEKDGIKTINFTFDIDSLKQTYVASISWPTNSKSQEINGLYIGCPPQSEMKYPETICYGMYNNTYSLDLYLPYLIYPEDDDNNEYAPNIMISGDETSKEINIEVSACDPDKYKQQALDYLNTTPIKLDEYNIEYKINNIDISC